jgi:hypothetical protein
MSGFFVAVNEFEHPKKIGVRIADGNSQGSQLLQTGLQRCCDGPAEGRSNPPSLAIQKAYSYFELNLYLCNIYCNVIVMSLTPFELAPSSFANTLNSVSTNLGSYCGSLPVNAVTLFGGTARSALLEAAIGIVRPIRDADIAAIGDELSDEDFVDLHHHLNPEDTNRATTHVVRHPDKEDLLKHNADFTINQVVLDLGNMTLLATSDALAACSDKLIKPTQARIERTVHRSQTIETVTANKQYLRDRTGMPTRAAYFTATLRAAGEDFSYDMLDHPVPTSPGEVHTFFTGLMVRKSLAIDELDRGAGDTTATNLMFEIYKEMGLIDDTPPKTVEQIVAFCQGINMEHPQLKYFGSEIAQMVQHTRKLPRPKEP